MDGHRLFLDDIRYPPSSEWTLLRNSRVALVVLDGLRLQDKQIETMSFDYDLGGDDTAYRVMYYLCDWDYWPTNIFVHSQNPVGAETLRGMVTRYAPDGTLKSGPGFQWPSQHRAIPPKE